MERRKQLQNVAFAGAWSQEIAEKEDLAEALEQIDLAVSRCIDEDLSADRAFSIQLDIALWPHPRGQEIRLAWQKALGIRSPGLRSREISRLARLIRSGVGQRIGQALQESASLVRNPDRAPQSPRVPPRTHRD